MSSDRPAARRSVTAAVSLVAAMGVLSTGWLGGSSQEASAIVTATCDFDAATGVLTVNNSGGGVVFIQRVRRRIDVHDVDCVDGDAVPTIDYTDVITIIGDAGNDIVIFRVREGPFGPGRTDEPGGSDEVEIEISLAAGDDHVEFRGDSDRDRVAAGEVGNEIRLNLNARERRPGVDHDVSIRDVESIEYRAEGGKDVLVATGRFGTGEALSLGISWIGGAHRDVLVGGAGSDLLDDRGPADVDWLNGRGGDDFLITRDRDTLDTAIGGRGDDRCVRDRGDVVRRCTQE